jgi:hypothetical protein
LKWNTKEHVSQHSNSPPLSQTSQASLCSSTNDTFDRDGVCDFNDDSFSLDDLSVPLLSRGIFWSKAFRIDDRDIRRVSRSSDFAMSTTGDEKHLIKQLILSQNVSVNFRVESTTMMVYD